MTGIPPNVVECRWSRQSQFQPISGSIACCERQVQYTAAMTDYGELITLVDGKRRSLLTVEDDDEVYDKKPQRYTKSSLSPRRQSRGKGIDYRSRI